MTPEALMKPRYKVIALYPQSNIIPFHINDILVKKGIHFTREENPKSIHENEIGLYPHLFKPLQWWHERKTDELPTHIGVKNEKGIFNWVHPVVKWLQIGLNEQGLCLISFTNLKGEYEEVCFGLGDSSPATLSDYTEFIAKK